LLTSKRVDAKSIQRNIFLDAVQLLGHRFVFKTSQMVILKNVRYYFYTRLTFKHGVRKGPLTSSRVSFNPLGDGSRARDINETRSQVHTDDPQGRVAKRVKISHTSAWKASRKKF